MSRDITTSLLNSLDDSVVYPFFAVDIDFSSGSLYVWSGLGNIVIGTKTYLGVGTLLNISSVEETTEIDAKGATITMSGIPSDFLSLALTEPYQGRECRIYFGMTSDPEDYVEVFAGELDQMNISEEDSAATISVTVENVLIKLERPVVRRFTNEDQKSRFPDDRGLEYVASLQDKEVFWGRTAKN
jgi:hypothetical protein